MIPTNKIINYLSIMVKTDHDGKPSKECVWKNNIRNFASLSLAKKINDKEVIVYNLCAQIIWLVMTGKDLWKK